MLSAFGDYRRFYPENETNTIQLTDRDEKIFGSIKRVLSFYSSKVGSVLIKDSMVVHADRNDRCLNFKLFELLFFPTF